MKKSILCLVLALCLCLCMILVSCKPDEVPEPEPEKTVEKKGQEHITPDTGAAVDPSFDYPQDPDSTLPY